MSELRKILTARHPTLAQRVAGGMLSLLAPAYWLAAQTKNALFDWNWKRPAPSPLPTISVGNLSVGGTGKSPAVIWIAGWLRGQGWRVAILSRGYGQLEDGRNDEALEMELLLPDVPQLQHWDRVASARLAAEELEMQCLLLDDGFQHRRLARDLDIVLIDASEPRRARRVLPAGLFREPMSNLARAQVVMLTRVAQAHPEELADLRATIQRHAPRAVIVESNHRPSTLRELHAAPLPANSLENQQILAFCGIGNPDSFFCGLESLGAQIVDYRTWPDHHGYGPQDLEQLEQWCRQHPQANQLVCTMKDWVKLQVAQIAGKPLRALQIELQIASGEPDLQAALRVALGEEERKKLEE